MYNQKMNYWIMKSEPNEFSIDNLKSKKTEPWDGIRNYQVRNMFRDEFVIGDRALFYHSNAKEIGVVGEMEIVSKAYPDPTQFDKGNTHYDKKSKTENPRWLLVDVKFIKKFKNIITLDEIKNMPSFKESPLVRKGNRLSVVPITRVQYQDILAKEVK